jgi:hypothetical protein
LHGQVPEDSLGFGTKVRVWYPGTAPGFREGVFQGQSGDTLSFRAGDSHFSVPAADILRLDRLTPGKSRWLAGMLIGGAVLGGVGAVLGAAYSDDYCSECEAAAPAVAAGVGILVGAGVGALIGSGIRADNWVTVVPLTSGTGSSVLGLTIYGRVALP